MATDLSVLGALQAQDLDGNPVRIGDYWRQRPVVLAFVRHFG